MTFQRWDKQKSRSEPRVWSLAAFRGFLAVGVILPPSVSAVLTRTVGVGADPVAGRARLRLPTAAGHDGVAVEDDWVSGESKAHFGATCLAPR